MHRSRLCRSSRLSTAKIIVTFRAVSTPRLHCLRFARLPRQLLNQCLILQLTYSAILTRRIVLLPWPCINCLMVFLWRYADRRLPPLNPVKTPAMPAASNDKERISWRNPEVDKSMGWGGGKKRSGNKWWRLVDVDTRTLFIKLSPTRYGTRMCVRLLQRSNTASSFFFFYCRSQITAQRFTISACNGAMFSRAVTSHRSAAASSAAELRQCRIYFDARWLLWLVCSSEQTTTCGENAHSIVVKVFTSAICWLELHFRNYCRGAHVKPVWIYWGILQISIN